MHGCPGGVEDPQGGKLGIAPGGCIGGRDGDAGAETPGHENPGGQDGLGGVGVVLGGHEYPGGHDGLDGVIEEPGQKAPGGHAGVDIILGGTELTNG